MTRITLDPATGVATVPYGTVTLRQLDTPAGPAIETSTGWFVAPYADYINNGGQLQPNPNRAENAVELSNRRFRDGIAHDYEARYPGYWNSHHITETYQNTTFYGTGYEGDRFVFGGMGTDQLLNLFPQPTIRTNELGMARIPTPNGSTITTFGVEDLAFASSEVGLSGMSTTYEWHYNDGENETSFMLAKVDNLSEVRPTNGIDAVVVDANISGLQNIGGGWYVLTPGKTVPVAVPEYLIGNDTSYQFSSTGELLRELPWLPQQGTTQSSSPVSPTPPTVFTSPTEPQQHLTSAATPVLAPERQPDPPEPGPNTISVAVTINGDNNVVGIGDIIIGVKDGRDRLKGTYGDDIITSNDGKDRLTGRAGADQFVIAGEDPDKITDYDEAEGDTLAVDKSLVKGLDTVLQVVDDKEGLLVTQENNLVYREDTGKLYADGDLLAKLKGAPELSTVEMV